MKDLSVVVFVLLLVSASAVQRFDDQLRELVESFRQQLPCGFPSIGIPPLAPYTKQLHTFDFNKVGSDLSGNLTNLSVTGIDGFDVKELTYVSVLMKIKFDVNFNRVRAFSQYHAKGSLQAFGKNISLFGDGDFDLEGENIRINGSFQLRPTTSNHLKIWNFKSSFDMDGVKSRTTGILHSQMYSGFFNTWVEEFFRLFIADNKDKIGQGIQRHVVPFVNEQLQKVSLLELMGLLMGMGSVDSLFPPCQV